MRDLVLINRNFKDLNPLNVGEEDCDRGHSYGPAMREYTLIHFVRFGSGTFHKDGEKYTVRAGEAFLILPGEITFYEASREDPWSYTWIGFDGALSEKFKTLPPVFPFERNWGEQMLSACENDGVSEYRVASVLFSLYAELFATEKPRNHYVRKVKNMIDTRYMEPLRVEEIADRINLDRRYLSRLFKEKTGESIQDYLISVRIEAAKRQLLRGASVLEAAQLSGYEDVCNFSKIFKREEGVSPGQWRREVLSKKGDESHG